MTDAEILETDLFEELGLSDVSIEDKMQFIEEFGRLLGATGLIIAGDKLSEKDQDTLVRLLEEEESERVEALLAARNISLEEITIEEAIRIKRAVIESDIKPASPEHLLIALKSNFPITTLELEWQQIANAVGELNEYIDGLQCSDDQKSRLADSVMENATLNLQSEVASLVSPEVFDQFGELIEADKYGEGIQLLLANGVDFVQLNVDEARTALDQLKEQIESLGLGD